MLGHRQSKFGYYQVGELTTFSKIEALEWHQRLGHAVQYRFNDAVFDCYDWTKEPQSTLVEIYQQRAQQIRAKYDYLVLFYSGGADSHNMLQSFVSQGIYVDEICSFGSLDGDQDKASTFNREVFESAAPFAQRLIDTNPIYRTTRFRFLDLSELIAGLLDRITLDNFAYIANSTVSVNNVARQFIRDWDPEYQRIMERQSLCFVWGHDKPRTMHRDGRFGIQFLDINDNCVGPRVQQLNHSHWHDELFYNSPDMPELIIKQTHEIMRWSKLTPTTDPRWTQTVTGLGHCIKHTNADQQAWWITQNGLSSIIYPWYDPLQYYAAKPRNSIFSERDRWYWADSVLGAKFATVINGVHQNLGSTWLNHNPERNTTSTKNFSTTFRFIE